MSVDFLTNVMETSQPVASTRQFANSELTGTDFLRLMIEQLAHQDPLDPVKNETLLAQVSAIKNMETLSNLDSTMKGMTFHQKVASGGALIGRLVSGVSNAGANVSGLIVSVSVSSTSGVNLITDAGDRINVDSVISIEEVPSDA